MTTGTWHVRDETLIRFAQAPRDIDAASASSTEAHLVTCERCRARLAEASPAPLIASSWERVADQIDRPPPRLVERALGLLGVRAEVARLAVVTPALQLAWLAAVAIVTALAVVAARQRDSNTLFLAVAPVVPLGSVAITFLRGSEPGGEASFAAPLSGGALMLRRCLAVITASMFCLVAGSFALPDLAPATVAWVLPALALTTTALAGATWRPVEHVAGALAVGWFAAVIGVRLGAGTTTLSESVLFTVSGQLIALGLSLAAAVIAVRRRDRLGLLGG
jgi:hypothetical protein